MNIARLNVRFVFLALVVALATAYASTRAMHVGVDGVTATLRADMLGGGGWTPVAFDDMVAGTDIVVRGVVEDVKPTRVATPTGHFLPVDPAAGPSQRTRQHLETPVVVRVREVLGRRSQGAPEADEVFASVGDGEAITLVVAGGKLEWTVSPAEAKVLGIKATRVERGREVETDPTEPVTVNSSVRPMMDLREGQEVMFFLAAQDEAWRTTVRIVGQGAFVLNSRQGQAVQASGHAAAVDIEDIRALARSVSRQSGRPLSGDQIQERSMR